jgi:MoxR-like ATPase
MEQAENVVRAWLSGRARVKDDRALVFLPGRTSTLATKLRRAYRWIASHAVVTPYADLELGETAMLGRSEPRLELGSSEAYASFILLPILNLMTSRRMVFVGGAGRGKTTMATLMAMLVGYDLKEIRRAVQHGHPQLGTADILGSPLPSELVRATDARDIHVAWRAWIGMRVKIVDEYNRIPTKTQSALLSLMSEGYAEMFEQIVECGRSAWYLTANDELGGGTFQVIDALKDRIDLVVRSTPFHAELLETLAERVESGRTPEELVPLDIVFSAEELEAIDREVRAVPLADGVLGALGFFLGQLEFCRRASDRFEYMSKDTLHLAGRRVGHVCNEDCPLDKQENLCAQTESGVSARAYQSLLHFAKALAYFRGNERVTTDDVRALLPWVLVDRLRPNLQSAFFQKLENRVLLTDRITWIRQLFDRALDQQAAYASARREVAAVRASVEQGVSSMSMSEATAAMTSIVHHIERLLRDNELNGPVHHDVVLLKGLHARARERVAELGRAAGRAS